MLSRLKHIAVTLVIGLACCLQANALSFDLDSIKEWGKFPRFVINTYRWGDQFFNGYDTAYVKGAGYKFNVKLRADSWLDYYNFDMPADMRMRMTSEPSTSMGVYLTYLAVSVGYDRNISKFFGSSAEAKQQYSFGFNCSLFSANIYYIINDEGMNISKFGRRGNTFNPNVKFDGTNSKTFGLDLCYFFSHKKYSQAAAFNFSRIQTKSHGSWFAGLSYIWQDYDFDFSQLPDYMKFYFPASWEDYHYKASNKTLAIKFGYGYNWVFAKHWLLGVSCSPTLGVRKGYINNPNKEKNTFAMSNQLRLSVVWNNGRWFAGMIGRGDVDILYDKDSTFENAQASVNFCIGYRFDLW